jgi:hypothetical protein
MDTFMAASETDTLQAFLEVEAAVESEMDAQILVLEPIGPLSGLTPILLDQPKQLIGWDVECAIQLPDAGVHSRHAAILRGQRQVVIKAWDPRTWLNGLPVTESPLSEGDLLRVGPIEFRIRAATIDELLRNVPATERILVSRDHSDSTGSLALRRSRLSKLSIRLKELRAELAREFERVQAERMELDSTRAALEADRVDLETERARFHTERATAAEVAAAPHASAPEMGPDRCDMVAKQWNQDADRMHRLFSLPVRPAANAAAAPELSATASPQPAQEQAPVEEEKESDDHAEIADSVADYMEHLLGRVRNRHNGVVAEDSRGRRTARDDVRSETADSPPTDLAGSAELPDKVRTAPPRRPHNVEAIRAGVGTLREIANLSARAAVAKHSSRKFRKSVAFTLPLAIISFALAGVLFLIGGSEARFYSQAFGIVMLGLIALIELANAFWKAKSCDAARPLTCSEDGTDATQSGGIGDGSGASSASAN